MREKLQLGVAIFTLAALAGLVFLGPAEESPWTRVSHLLSLLFSVQVLGLLAMFWKSLAEHPVALGTLAAAPILLYLAGIPAKRKMNRTFSGLWSGLVPRLRGILLGW